MLIGGCWVTQSLDHAVPWVFGPVVSQQHRAGSAADSPSALWALTFPSLHQAPCSSSLAGPVCLGTTQMHLHHPQVTAEPSSAQPFSLLPPHLLLGGERAEASALVWVPWGLIPAGPCMLGAGRNRPPFGEPVGTCQCGLHPGYNTALGPFSASPRVSKRRAFLLLPS